jgi:hypothetical protein
MVDFSPNIATATYHSIEELKSNEKNAVLNGRFYGSHLYVMGGLRSLTPQSSYPTFYDSVTRTTGYLLKYSASPNTESLPDSCFQQKTISYLTSGFNSITQAWVDPSVSPVNEEVFTATSRSFSEASTGFNSADIKQAEVLVEKTEG